MFFSVNLKQNKHTWNSVCAWNPKRIRFQMVDGVVSNSEFGGAVGPAEGSGLNPGNDVTVDLQHLQMTQTTECRCLDGVNVVSLQSKFPQLVQFVESSSFQCWYLIVQNLQVNQTVHSPEGPSLNDVNLVTLDVQFYACAQMGKGVCWDDWQFAVQDFNQFRINWFVTWNCGHVCINHTSDKVEWQQTSHCVTIECVMKCKLAKETMLKKRLWIV